MTLAPARAASCAAACPTLPFTPNTITVWPRPTSPARRSPSLAVMKGTPTVAAAAIDTLCGLRASASALAALPVSTSLRPLACCFINGVLWLRGASALVRRRQVPQLPRLCGARELSAEVLDDAACLGDEIGVAAGELALAEVDRVF